MAKVIFSMFLLSSRRMQIIKFSSSSFTFLPNLKFYPSACVAGKRKRKKFASKPAFLTNLLAQFHHKLSNELFYERQCVNQRFPKFSIFSFLYLLFLLGCFRFCVYFENSLRNVFILFFLFFTLPIKSRLSMQKFSYVLF